MFGEVSCARDSASVLEERKLLQQLVSLGVGYPYGKSWFSKAAITDTNTLQCQISRELYSRKYSDAGSIIREIKDRIRNGDDGYYFLDLDNGRILAKGQHPIEDMIVDFTISGADDRVLLRRRIGACLHNAGFLIVPDAVYFLWENRVCMPLNEFHMLSFISSEDTSKSGFVVDYDAVQNNRPLVLFPCEENSDIIQSQLDHDDRCWTEEHESLIGNTSFYWRNI